MADQNSQYMAILTAVGEAKLANAQALGTDFNIAEMAVGDGGGIEPTPDRLQTALLYQRRRAPLNQLIIDPNNAAVIIAEQVIPEDIGGWWIREIGLYDDAGDLVAVANCPPTFKPQLAQGSGRTQVVRLNLLVSSTQNITLRIDPSVVLATRSYVDISVAAALARLDSKDSVLVATTANIALTGTQTIDGVAVPAGARVLVKDQTQGRDNGIYIAAAGAWTRALDANTSAAVTPGMTVPVEQGNQHADTIFELTTNSPITLGTTALTFELTAALNATESDAITGTNNTRRMTALRVFQALRAVAANATETLRGVLRIATQAEVDTGELDDVAVTPKKLRWGIAFSIAANGYLVFPSWLGGFVIQWMSVTTPAASLTHTEFSWPIAFPANYLSIAMAPNWTPSTAQSSGLAIVQRTREGGWLRNNGPALSGTVASTTIFAWGR